MKVAHFCGSDILDVQIPRNEVDLRVGVQGLLDAELCVACSRNCFDFLLGGCGGILITLLRC